MVMISLHTYHQHQKKYYSFLVFKLTWAWSSRVGQVGYAFKTISAGDSAALLPFRARP